jgi:squalene-hopene/tetraprenyl-beta-curcumene cyclase
MRGLWLELDRFRTQLAGRLAARIEPDGSIQGRCASRGIESALFLRLLRDNRLLPDVQERLARYLEHAVPAHQVESLVQAAVLGRHGQSEDTAAFLRAFDHPTGERKRILLSTVLALVGARQVHDPPVQDIPPYRGNAVWTDLTLCAIKIIHDCAGGRSVREDQAFLERLLRAQPVPGVWQGNLFAHLMGLHAVAVADPGSPLLRQGVSALSSQLNPDGGIPFISGQDVWVSALAGSALARSTPDAGATAAKTGGFIAAQQLPDGGWGYDHSTSQSDVDDTSRCVALLESLDPAKYRRELAEGRSHLAARAGQDGGFPTYMRGDRSEADLTAGSVIALAGHSSTRRGLLVRAGEFLLSAQHEQGWFDPSWTRSQASVLAHVVEALEELERVGAADPARAGQAIGRAVSYLLREQNSDGGWGRPASDALATAHAVTALAGRADPERLSAALSLLLSAAEHPRLPARPDQIGPRPIPYDFPVLVDVHVLTALNRALEAHHRQHQREQQRKEVA